MVVKIIVILLFVFIFVSLASALFSLLSERGSSDKMLKALTVRIALSILIFILLLGANAVGWI